MIDKTIVVTRPVAANDRWSEILRQAGYHIFHEPLLTITPIDSPSDFSHARSIILTSQHALPALLKSRISRKIPVYAVGEHTTQEATNAGFMHTTCAGQNVEALRRLMDSTPLPKPCFYLSGTHVTDTLHHHSVERVIVYRADAATRFSDHGVRLLGSGEAISTFLSARSAQVFSTLTAHHHLSDSVEKLTGCFLSAAVANAANHLRWKHKYVATQPTLASMLKCVDNAAKEIAA